AEYCQYGKPAQCFIAITLGTGVGGGIILDGKIYSGHNGIAAELGHIVINENSENCGCGRKGCWESYASVSALIRQTKAAMKEDKNTIMHSLVSGNIDLVSGKTAFDAAKSGDKTAAMVVENYINHISVGICNIINIFQPEVIAIGGAISKEGDYLLNPIKEYCQRESYGGAFADIPEITIASLGNDAGIIGAAMLGKSNGVV
ncbi:MAG: ROK family protein, partial [Monoglobales bacterium]